MVGADYYKWNYKWDYSVPGRPCAPEPECMMSSAEALIRGGGCLLVQAPHAAVWKAWRKLKDMSKHEAMVKFVGSEYL